MVLASVVFAYYSIWVMVLVSTLQFIKSNHILRLSVRLCALSCSSRSSLQIMYCTTSSPLGIMHLLCPLQQGRCYFAPSVSCTTDCEQLRNKYAWMLGLLEQTLYVEYH